MSRPLALLFTCVVLSTGCYHATISTGATPSSEVIEKPSASGWIVGLIPPSTVETAAKCPNGVAKVETQRTFVNQFVSFLTMGIYTPMSIKVTCAAARQTSTTGALPDVDMVVQPGTDRDGVQDAFTKAADRSAREGKAVFIQVQ